MEAMTIYSKYDKEALFCNYYPVENPKAIIQIIHGMKEHQVRYEPFANYLNKNGYSVITSDLRGHGKNATLLGYMPGKEPWEALILDQVSITEKIKTKCKDTPVYLFAHSMGTIITRNLIQKYDHLYQKIVLSGVPAYQSGVNFGIMMANLIGSFKSDNYVSKFLENQTLKPFEKAIKDAKTSVDWISLSQKNIDNYLNDPYCNIPFTISAYKALYHLVKGMHQVKAYKVSNPVLPILMLVGAEDPCPLGEKGLNQSISTLSKAGYSHIESKRYENLRHEILNEDSKKHVYEDILKFFEQTTA